MATVTGFDLDATLGGNNGTVAYVEGQNAILLAANAVVTALGNFNGQTLTISGLLAEDVIGFASGVSIAGKKNIKIGNEIVGTFAGGADGSDFVITFTSKASAASVQTVLRNITFQDISDSPTVNQSLTFNLAGTSRIDDVTVTAVNDAAVLDLNGINSGNNATTSFIEQTPITLTPLAVVLDADSASLTSLTATLISRPDGNVSESLSLNAPALAAAAGLNVSYNQSTGALSIIGAASQATYQAILRGIQYNNTSDNPTSLNRTIQIVVNDGADSSLSRTVTVSVAATNDAPVVDLNGGAPDTSTSTAYSVGDPPTIIALAGTVGDADSENFKGGSLRVAFTQNGTASDQLGIVTDAVVNLTGHHNLKINGMVIGTVSGGNDGSELVIQFTTNNATVERVQTLLEHIGYFNTSATPSTLPRVVDFTLDDGDGGQKGSATATINFPSMPTEHGFRIFGADAGDHAGYSVSSAGDINGDGFDDLIIGANWGDGVIEPKIDSGESIVVFGKSSGFTDIDVSTMTAAEGFRIFGADVLDNLGYSVSSAGDINGDGFDDLIMYSRQTGEAIVVFGKSSGFTDIDVVTMTAEEGFRIFGANEGDSAGISVSSAGDINGDGFDDLIVGARGG